MALKDYKKTLQGQLRKATLCFLIIDDKVLLAMKKRGFGQGKLNGIGGKVQDGESVEEAAIRETQEEVGVTPKKLERVATLNFYFPHVPTDHNWNQQVCVFMVKEWEGEPEESEEMKPEWFNIDAIPYKSMWEDDAHWLPQVLRGELLTGDFSFTPDQSLDEFEITNNLDLT